ncbi:thiosulfate sulfurtransferase GlpE [Mannheimia massilioguelmaensis]|uniref:thiosulfate sulfurtransferase GlpE n=1 Tax=Mannheimia massilioguelmaensis TaxID=1604354 RepID=UPI0005CB3EC1|nr:thiosulfate sulfurtransferase GlpE [Mannheimia massilioguelmaensis]
MTEIIQITPQQAWDMMNSENAVLLDIRDEQRFTYSHAKGAFHLTNQTYGKFQDLYDFDDPIILSCYHGVSSLNVGKFLIEQGYDNVYSVIGGFENWEKAKMPIETAYSQD